MPDRTPPAARNPRWIRLVAAAVGTATLLGGCTGEVNHSSGLGGGVELETFSDRTPVLPPPGPNGDGPSIVGIDRDNWPTRTVLAPAGNVEHYPTYTSGLAPRYARDLPRQRGEFPTEDSALDTWTGRSRLPLATEGLAAPFYAGFDILAAPVRFFMAPPWVVVNSPGWRQRTPIPANSPPSAEPAAPAAAPANGTMEPVR